MLILEKSLTSERKLLKVGFTIVVVVVTFTVEEKKMSISEILFGYLSSSFVCVCVLSYREEDNLILGFHPPGPP